MRFRCFRTHASWPLAATPCLQCGPTCLDTLDRPPSNEWWKAVAPLIFIAFDMFPTVSCISPKLQPWRSPLSPRHHTYKKKPTYHAESFIRRIHDAVRSDRYAILYYSYLNCEKGRERRACTVSKSISYRASHCVPLLSAAENTYIALQSNYLSVQMKGCTGCLAQEVKTQLLHFLC